MWIFASGQDIHDKINALNGGNSQTSTFLTYVSWAVIAILIVLVAFLISRSLFKSQFIGRRRERRGRSRGDDQKTKVEGGIENGKLDVDVSEEDIPLYLADLRKDTRVSLFWDVGELRCGCLGFVLESHGDGIDVAFDSDSAPRQGRAVLVCPEIEGHVSFYEIKISQAIDSKSRFLEPVTRKSASRMNRRFRAHVAVQGALIARDNDGLETEPILVRIHDMAFDGLGVLSEGRIKADQTFTLRMQLPGYLEPYTLEGRVAWSEKDLAGIYRAGFMVDFDDVETRLNLADYMFSRLKAESSAIILEKRRNEHTSQKIPQVVLKS